MAQIEGFDPDELEQETDAVEAAVAAGLAAIAAAMVAQALPELPGIPDVPDLPSVPDVPGVPAVPPPPPLVDIDSLSVIPTMWLQHVDEVLMPMTDNTVRLSAILVESDLIDAGLDDVPEIADTTVEDILSVARNRLVGIGDDLWENVRTGLVEGVSLGETVPELADRIRGAAAVSEPRARTIARTEVIGASNAASIAQARSAGIEMNKVWLATEDARTREAHEDADGQSVPLNDMFEVGGEMLDFPGDPRGRADNIINCFPADVVAQPIGRLKRVYRRWYEGDLVEIETASGLKLSGTPNHPVLTAAGLLPMQALYVGAKLVKPVLAERVRGGDPQIGDVPAQLGEMYSAAQESGMAHRVVGCGMDFHGDGTSSEVDIVTLDGGLPDPVGESPSDDVLFGIARAEVAFPRSYEAGNTSGIHVIPQGGERLEVAPTLVGARSAALAVFEGRRSGTDSVGFAGGSLRDSTFFKPGVDGSAGHAQSLGKLLNGGTREISLDDVVGVERKSFAGHVFNLETESGHYVANGIAVGNCRCAIGYEFADIVPITAAGREYVRDREGQFAETPEGAAPTLRELVAKFRDWAAAGAISDYPAYEEDEYEDEFGEALDNGYFNDDASGGGGAVRVFEDGSSHVLSEFVASDGKRRYQPLTEPLTSEDLYAIEEALSEALALDLEDYEGDATDELGALDIFDAGPFRFGVDEHGDIQVRMLEPPPGWDGEEWKEKHLWDLSSEEADQFRRMALEMASVQQDIEPDGEDGEEPVTAAAGHDPELCTCMDGGRNHGKPGPCPGWVDALPESHPRRVARRERAAERTFERMTRDTPRSTRRRREPEADPHEARREWQRRVDLLRDRAETLAKVEEQLYKDVDDDRVLSHVINAANRKHDFSNDPVMAPLLTADVSDRAALRATVRQAAQELGMTRVGGERLVTIQNRFGDFEVERGHYRRGVMQPLGGERIREGEPVDVHAPGFTAVVDGQEVTLVPAVVAKAELGAGETEIGETAMSTAFDEPVVAADRGNLREYWVHGEGAAKIRWGTDGAFKRCVRQLRKYSEGETEFDTEGLCANMYREATGRWPGSKKDSSILVAAARRYKRDSEGRFAKTAAQVVKEVDDLMARLASLKSSIADDYDEDSGVNLDDALEAMRELRERQAEKAERREALMDTQDHGEINIYLHQDGDVGVTPDEGAEEWFTSAENARELAAGIDDLRKKMPPTPTPGVAGMFETADGSVYARAWNSGDVEIGLTSDRDAPITDDEDDEVVPSIVMLRSEEAAEFADLLEEMANRSMGEDEPVTAAYRDYAADELLDDEPCLPCLEPQPGEMWHAVFHTEGMSTGARVWEPGALSWREPPFAFHWEKEAPAHGGTPRVVQVGNVLRVLREGTRLHAWGNLDIDSEDGAEVARKLEKGFLRWISMGPGSEKIVYEQVWPANVDASQMGRVEPEQTIFIDYRIGELTAVSVPAQEGGFIEPVGELAREITTASGSSWTIEIPDLPPAWWFDKPVDMPKNAAVTVTDEGRIYGYLAPANSGHRSYARNGERKTLAHLPKTDYSRWLKETIVAGGGRVLAGPLTMECMHAPTQGYGQLDRRHQYYEDSCSIIARVNIGEDPDDGARWIAGAMMPGVTAEQFLKFLSSDVSLDQQPHPDIPGVQDFVGILAVPVGGWPKSRTTASVPVTRMEETPDGAVMVASAVPVRHETMGDDLVEQLTIATHDPALCTCMDGGPNHGKRGPCPGWKGKRQTPSVAPEPGTMGKKPSEEQQNRRSREALEEGKARSDRMRAAKERREGRQRSLEDSLDGMNANELGDELTRVALGDEEPSLAQLRAYRSALGKRNAAQLRRIAARADIQPRRGAKEAELVDQIMAETVEMRSRVNPNRQRPGGNRRNTGLEITPEVFASIVGVDLGAVVRNNAAMFATSLGGV